MAFSGAGTAQGAPSGVAQLRLAMSNWIKDGKLDVPTMPQVLAEAMRLSQTQDTTVTQLEKLIEKDQSVAGRLVQIANSPLLRRTRDASSIREAIVRIGQKELKHTLFELFIETRLFRSRLYPELVRALWQHSLAAASLGRHLAPHIGQDADTLFLTCLVHDAGKAALLANITDDMQINNPLPPSTTEAAMQSLHELAGGVAVRLWNMPKNVIEATLRHHSPEKAEIDPTLARAVYAVDHLVYYFRLGLDKQPLNEIDDSSPLYERRKEMENWEPLEDPILAELAISQDILDHLQSEMENIKAELASGFAPARHMGGNKGGHRSADGIIDARQKKSGSKTGLWVGLAIAAAAIGAVVMYVLSGNG